MCLTLVYEKGDRQVVKKSKVIGMIIAFGCAVLGMEALGIQPVKTVYAQEAADQIITNDENGIPDKNLYDVLLEKCDNNGDGILTVSEAEDVHSVTLRECNITSLKGIKYLKGVRYLYLDDNNLTDISELGELKDLGTVSLDNNDISDISALGQLPVSYISANNNHISDIGSLKNAKKLNMLLLSDNKITDVSSLNDLRNLTYLIRRYFLCVDNKGH